MATTNLFGNYAPAMQEPYNIETALAKEATGGSSAVANSLLNQYWYERQMREGEYGARMANQMDFAKQQLASQIADQNVKSMTEAAKVPGMLRILASSPAYSGIFGGADPTALQGASDTAQQTAQAKILESTGKGAQGMAAGGYGLSIPMLSNMTGAPVTPQMPTAVAAQAMANQGRIGAAQIRAAASGGGTTPISTGPIPELGNEKANVPVPKNVVLQGPAATTQWMSAHGWGGPQQVPNPNATGATNTAPPSITGRTNLPVAKTDTPANNAPAAATPKAPVVVGPADMSKLQSVTKNIIANDKSLPPAQKQDLANFKLQKGSDGTYHVHGASGNDYGSTGVKAQ